MSRGTDVQPAPPAVPFAMVRGATRRFATLDGHVDALVDVDLDVAAGELTVVAGPSGSGKSTLLSILAGLERGDRGEVTVGSLRVDRLSTRARRTWRRTEIGVVMPRPSDNLTVVHDAAGNLVWSDVLRGARPPMSVDDARRRLDELGLGEVGARSIPQLSGGEQMRLAFACAAVGDPPLVVADEPTASLDSESGHVLLTVIRRLTASGTAVVVASHDPELVDAADVVVRLDDGRRIS
ncbi:MAG: ATP-binding cassette domain-containing protein [Ilumatobacter sp.]|nr:ATP-binding cassette domain-containing protein [Ilumatobacter sp.]